MKASVVRQQGFAIPALGQLIAGGVVLAALVAGGWFLFSEFKTNYLELGQLRATKAYMEQINSLRADLDAKRKEIESFAVEKADAVKVAVEELELAHKAEVDNYARTVEAYRSNNKKLLAELSKTKRKTDRPVVNTTPGKLSDVAVNTINRLLAGAVLLEGEEE